MNVGSVIDLIGNMFFFCLNVVLEMIGCEIFGKVEFFNFGGFIKDCVVLGIICVVECSGVFKFGGIIVEGMVGNIGIGFVMVGVVLGYRVVIVFFCIQLQEKKDVICLLGVEFIEVDVVFYFNLVYYVCYLGQFVVEFNESEFNGVVWVNQFDNQVNWDFYVEIIVQEIWDQMDGKVSGFICVVGFGGIFGGVL